MNMPTLGPVSRCTAATSCSRVRASRCLRTAADASAGIVGL
jgi:hypothetical protein